MAELGEYLGHLLCEVTRARVRADMEAVRVAREYVADESQLLRHFPVPRMRLPTLEITVPVQINAIPDGFVEKTPADTTVLAKVLADELGPALKAHKLHIDTREIVAIIKADPRLSRGELYEGFADMLSAKLHDHTRALGKRTTAATAATAGATFKQVADLIRDRIAVAMRSLPRKPLGISIEPRTAILREVGNPALLLNLKLSISEDALDIHLEDQDSQAGEGKDDAGKRPQPRIKRLLPE